MFLTTFVSSLNKGNLITPILLKRKLIVEFRSTDKGSHFLELSSSESKLLSIQPVHVDFVIEGEESDLEEVFLHPISLKQLISFGKLSIKGSYRDFLRLEALIKLI
ncbi:MULTISPECIES: SCP2 sterol-binding domain-containing protein [Bacillaceae]|uniref:SCP2 sterol-binding domain-containing protein n=1 Tax=Bacillaceae TaxID=186817 RepID=UPI000BFB2283|nr:MULTISPECIES: SCP2 sterol-binding domain-containing protein [Bacillaceae]MCM3161209.1 SCP2 sterol-binding domain-containing protein [Metabacillus litoralis]MCM3412083.1 SCP2 sterol-binding domain-containing protein [Metabacillus litoralis]PGT85363.1 hypothetical protein COD11_09035 [Bacillus sp. AFS040349]UGB30146.1 SCP2 sterol-binding domain-containing protein [Metabacillus sp. B2-18]UHA61910.1 SCP2 sterol-binding domain-containing protein [Metabacillus litoralis]